MNMLSHLVYIQPFCLFPAVY